MKVTGSTIEQLEKDRPRNRCRRWRLWATTEEGRKSKRVSGTYTQAQEALRGFVSSLEERAPEAGAFGPYAASWLSWREKSGDYSPNTIAGDGTCLAAIGRTALQGMDMASISPEDCRDALAWLKSHAAGGGEYKPATMAKVHQVLNAVLQQAEDDGRIARNPMARVKRPRVRQEEREALSPAELMGLLDRVDSLPVDGKTTAVYLMACLGLRCGEACAIRDAQVGELAEVDSTVRGADGSVGAPKSPSGRRRLPVPPRLAGRVALWRECREALGFGDAEYLCCNSKGGMLTTSAMENWWRDTARGKLGCEGMTLHQLRHSNLSMMARHMSVFDLQRYAGWSSIVPARIYVHADMESVSRAVADAWG